MDWVPSKIRKAILYGGQRKKRKKDKSKKRWEDEVMKLCGVVFWKILAMDRSEWRRMCAVYCHV